MSGLPNLKRISEAATPGPWNVVEDGDGNTVVTNFEEANRFSGFAVSEWWYGQLSDEEAAMIAAAPEMARLLQECAEAIERVETYQQAGGNEWWDAHDKLYGLLARLAEFDRGLA